MTRLLPPVVIATALLVLFACAKRKDSNDLAQHQAELKGKLHEYAAQNGAQANWLESMRGRLR